MTDRLVHKLSIIATPKSVKGSLRERSPGVWQVRVSLGRDPATHRYRYAAATVRGANRDAQRAAAGLVSEAITGGSRRPRRPSGTCRPTGSTTSRPGGGHPRPRSRSAAWPQRSRDAVAEVVRTLSKERPEHTSGTAVRHALSMCKGPYIEAQDTSSATLPSLSPQELPNRPSARRGHSRNDGQSIGDHEHA